MPKLLPITTSSKNRKYDWLNTLVHIHNLQCGCDDPLGHTVEEIFEQEPGIKEKYTKCPGPGDPSPTGEEDVLGAGDLDALFAADFGEENTTGDTR